MKHTLLHPSIRSDFPQSTSVQDSAQYAFPRPQDQMSYSENLLFTLSGFALVLVLIIIRMLFRKKKKRNRL